MYSTHFRQSVYIAGICRPTGVVTVAQIGALHSLRRRHAVSQGKPQRYTILKFVLSSSGLGSNLLTVGNILDLCHEIW
jgi:hypothetical protein